MPLAEIMNFLFRKNELVIFFDNEKTSRFAIQQMTLRQDWDRERAHKEFVVASKELAEK